MMTRAFGKSSRYFCSHLWQMLDVVVNDENLPTAQKLAAHSLLNDHRQFLDDVGLNRQPVVRRRLNDAHVLDAGQREIQGARDRRRRKREHVDIFLQRFDLFLVLDAEAAAPRR